MYQYIMYTLSMWNSYLFVASLDVFVVLLAGLISIVSARRSQKAIEQVCNCSTLVTHQTWLLCHLINCFILYHLVDHYCVAIWFIVDYCHYAI